MSFFSSISTLTTDCSNIYYMRPLGQRYQFDLLEYLNQCDLNYVYLFQLLCRDTSAFRSTVVSLGAVNEETTFEVIDNTRYTSTVKITRKMPSQVGDLKFTVRVFHDLQCTDLLSFQGEREYDARYSYPNRRMRSPDEKTQNTRFLGEILKLCVSKGRKLAERSSTLTC